jgi:hypothetical protein
MGIWLEQLNKKGNFMAILKTKKHSSNKIDRMKKGLINPKNVTPLNLLIDSKLHTQFKIKTINNGTSMTEVLVEAIREYLS